MTIEIKKLEGKKVVVEITTQQIQNPQTKEISTLERAVAYTDSQIDDNLANVEAQKARWQAMKVLLEA